MLTLLLCPSTHIVYDAIKTLWTAEDIEEASLFYERAYLKLRTTIDNDNGDGEDGAQDGDHINFNLTESLLKDDMGAKEIAAIPYLTLLEQLGVDKYGRMPNMRSFEKRANALPEHWAGTTDPDTLPHQAAYEKWLPTVPKQFASTPTWLLPTFPPKPDLYPQEREAIENTPICISLLRPHPHQVQAIAVLTSRIFLPTILTPEKRRECMPYLGPPAVSIHADAMGLGKTYQALGTIAYISHLRSLQKIRQPLPAFFGEPLLNIPSPPAAFV